jgi:hypothetical protein
MTGQPGGLCYPYLLIQDFNISQIKATGLPDKQQINLIKQFAYQINNQQVY